MSSFVKQSFAAAMVLTALNGRAQYSTPVGTGAAKPKTLRATAVLEYTGTLEKPGASRLMPIAVWDGEQYQPAGLYMAQPEPLAFAAGTEYELERSGEAAGLFEVRTAAQLRGQWIGMGKYEPEPPPPPPKKLKVSKQLPVLAGGKPTTDESRPTLHRKGADENDEKTPVSDGSAKAGAGKSTGAAQDAGGQAASAGAKAGSAGQAGSTGTESADSDKPTLHRRTEASSSTADGDTSSSKAPEADPDRPTLHKHEESSAGGAGTAENDPDRPTLHRARSNTAAFTSASADPDRPHLRYGEPSDPGSSLLPPKLEGAPPQMQQIVAVSDSAPGGAEKYRYQWSSPEDEAKMRAALAAVAAKAVLRPTTAAAAVPGGQTRFGPAARASARKGQRAATAADPPALEEEQFASYELSFSGGATVVYTAHTADEGAKRVYVALIAQPDFNGTPQILLQQVARGDRLDETPAMHLVDAVDTDDDRRAELVFELTGGPMAQAQGSDTSVSYAPVAEREFAIYKVAGGRVSQVFNTGALP